MAALGKAEQILRFALAVDHLFGASGTEKRNGLMSRPRGMPRTITVYGRSMQFRML